MNIEKIFEPQELEGLVGNQLQQKAAEIRQRFDYRRNYYHNLRNNFPNLEKWMELNKILVEFDKGSFQSWNPRWSNLHRSPNVQNLTNYFNEGKQIFQEFEDKIDELNLQIYTHSEEVEDLKKDVLNKIDNDLITLKTEVIEIIESGINDVLDLKAELGLHQNFSENLNIAKINTEKAKNWFITGFIASLLLIVIVIIITYNLDFVKELETTEKIILRIGITTVLGFISYFMFHQFKLFQMLHLRYTHLSNFLGGGATYINQIIGQDGDLKKLTNQKLAEMFMEIDDTIGVVKKMKHPSEASLTKTNEMLSDLLGKLASITKNISEIQK